MAMTEHQDMVLSGLKTKTPEQNGTGTMKNIIMRVDLPNGATKTCTYDMTKQQQAPNCTTP